MKITMQRAGPIDLTVPAPPSKSYTHRALIISALAEGSSEIRNPLSSGDIDCTRMALRSLGIVVQERDGVLSVRGSDGRPDCPDGLVLDLGNSGTSFRLLASWGLLCGTPLILTGSARMQERPVGPLVAGLNALGGRVTYLRNAGYPPVRIAGDLKGGDAWIEGQISSQFISSVLIIAPYAKEPVHLDIRGEPASRSYIDLTCDVMEAFGGRVLREGYSHFEISTTDRYRGRTFVVEGDLSSASYFFAMAAVTRGRVRVTGVNPASLQGDLRFVSALESMGCSIRNGRDMIEVSCEGALEGIDIDMSAAPDTVQTLCVVAACARSETRISGVSHLRYKESDRLAETASLLNSLGGSMKVDEGEIFIRPSPLHGGTIDPRNDHRTAMSFAVLGLAVGGITILNAECAGKSFPGFWDLLRGGGLA